ncbi:MAG: UDP-N-acetylmuramoyl-tripeptide--D-alanyl-D-alanine ligase [Alphaproteobacteria bacterium]|nr:UDP-N-acetylmuramoyl-tripeptide--D-alanyl-D-alanine ligase [Alphaproteobacteria bacterium]MCL2504901.1 UDP-N-acetylmuramoyl-tripeptide--D-alanyl-D-alanine ligase [Alphaproteobacteria bacterium]
MIEGIAYIILSVSIVFFSFKRLLRYLHVYQQDEYKSLRFAKWIFGTNSFDKKTSIFILAVDITVLAANFYENIIPLWIAGLICAGILIYMGRKEVDPRINAKKKLVMTHRASRVFGIAFLIACAMGVGAASLQIPIYLVVAVQLIPATLMLANMLLMPYENYVQKRIIKEAKENLRLIVPATIGITGSFGKTSVKHMLGHILKINSSVAFTPGTVNTLMGVSRIIREDLLPNTKYFIVEMGAYNRGSIEKMCNLAAPKMGIITALGEAHLERFKSLDNIAKAKFELAEAVIANGDGKIVVGENVLEREYAKEFISKHRDRFIICGFKESCDLRILSVNQSINGVTTEIEYMGQAYGLSSPLYGKAHGINMATAFAAAIQCGIEPEKIVLALHTLPSIQHRLAVIPNADGTTYIDDAYNSNQKGFENAMELLDMLGREKKGRRILISPGIIELGEKSYEVHRELGLKAAKCADVLIVIRADRLKGLGDGFKEGGAIENGKTLLAMDNFAEAVQWLRSNLRAPDVYLVENDLIDLTESKGLEL